jgi:hypothetical protein
MELSNVREVESLERSNKKKKGKKEYILERIKIPNCRYLNDVIYVREKFEFRYDLDFFIHYFDHRFFHKKKFYDMVDTSRWVAQKVIKLVGNTKYRHTDFNKVVDSIAMMMPYYPVPEFLDSVITELNLEYLATGEIKVKYKDRRQRSVIARIKPSKKDSKGGGSLGDIKFYTSNKRRVIEELDASVFDSLVIAPDSTELKEQILMDSLNTVITMKTAQDSIYQIQDSLSILNDSLALTVEERKHVHSILDSLLWSSDSTETKVADRMELHGDITSVPISVDNFEDMILMAEKQKSEQSAERQKRKQAALLRMKEREEAASTEESPEKKKKERKKKEDKPAEEKRSEKREEEKPDFSDLPLAMPNISTEPLPEKEKEEEKKEEPVSVDEEVSPEEEVSTEEAAEPEKKPRKEKKKKKKSRDEENVDESEEDTSESDGELLETP